jgi:hypothetical protein
MAQPHPKTLLELADQCPPFLVLALARRPGALRKGMSISELSASAKIPVRTLERILASQSWKEVKIGVATRILLAAGMNVMCPARIRQYMRSTAESTQPFRHLTKQQRNNLFYRMGIFTPVEPESEATPLPKLPVIAMEQSEGRPGTAESPEEEFRSLVAGQAEP